MFLYFTHLGRKISDAEASCEFFIHIIYYQAFFSAPALASSQVI